jgi:hypothetical protein
MDKCRVIGCYQDALNCVKRCFVNQCPESIWRVVCNDHNAFYICPNHKRIGTHPKYNNIIHNEYFEFDWCNCGNCPRKNIIISLNKNLALYVGNDSNYYLLSYCENVFPFWDTSRCTKINDESHMNQLIYSYTYKSHLFSWKTDFNLYLSVIPTDICNIISLYL